MLPACRFFPTCVTPGISGHPHPEGEPRIYTRICTRLTHKNSRARTAVTKARTYFTSMKTALVEYERYDNRFSLVHYVAPQQVLTLVSHRTYLVNEVLKVLVSQRLPRSDDPVHIGLHEICHDIHIFEVGGVRRNRHDVGNRDDILVSVEMPQQLDLPHDALRVYEVAENVADFLDRHLAALDLQQNGM